MTCAVGRSSCSNSSIFGVTSWANWVTPVMLPPGRLIDELVPCRTTMVDEIVVGFEDAVGEPVVAHKLPDVLDRVELWALRRQHNDGDIGRQDRKSTRLNSSH